MKSPVVVALAIALFASGTLAQAICEPSDGSSIKTWMASCDTVVGSASKCANSACHAALHRLEEQDTQQCWVFLGLGSPADFVKYKVLDNFCHGEGPNPDLTPAPTSKVSPIVNPVPAPSPDASVTPVPTNVTPLSLAPPAVTPTPIAVNKC